METNKIIILAIIGIVSFAVSLTVVQLFIRKRKLKSEVSKETNLSYSVLFLTWVISFTILNFKLISMLNEFIDLVHKTNSQNPIQEIVKTSILFIGLANVWLIIWNSIANAFSLIFIGKKDSMNEIANNNYAYFLMKGTLAVSFVYCSMPIFEIALKHFLPNIEIPFYH